MYYSARQVAGSVHIKRTHKKSEMGTMMVYTTDDLDNLREHLLVYCDLDPGRCDAAISCMKEEDGWVEV